MNGEIIYYFNPLNLRERESTIHNKPDILAPEKSYQILIIKSLV